MPYINEGLRHIFDNELSSLGDKIETAGDLDYCITRLCVKYLKTLGGVKFENLAVIAGVLSLIQLENYKRITSPYEDKKQITNGDVYI